MNLSDLQELLKSKLLEARSLYYLVTSEKFEDCYTRCNIEQQEQLMVAIKNNNREFIVTRIKESTLAEIESMTMKDLRNLAKELGVRSYNILTKPSLLSAIKLRQIDVSKINARNDDSTTQA